MASWAFLAAEFVHGWDKAPASVSDVSGEKNGYYVLLAGKTPWQVGPLARYDRHCRFSSL